MQVWRRFPALPWVLLVAAACRVAVFFAFPGVFDFAGTGTIHGSEAYDTYARNLLATGVYGLERGTPDAALPPAYGFVLAGIYGLFGRSSLAVAAVQTAFDLGTIALLAAVGGALFRSAAVGALAGVMTACYPYLVFQTLAVNDTALFLLELHAFVWLVVLVRDRPVADHPSVALAAAAGLVLGAGALTRPAILVVACGAAAWLLLAWPLREVMRRLAPIVLVSGLVLAAWTGRNQLILGSAVPIATNGGSNFWQGNNAGTLAYLRAGIDVQWIPPGPLGGVDHRDPASNRLFFGAGLRFLTGHPRDVPALLWEKLRAHWSLDVFPRRNPSRGPDASFTADPGPAVSAYSGPLFDRLGRSVHRLTWGAALLLAAAGFAATRLSWREVSLVWSVEASLTLFYVAFHPSTRYRLPGDPLLFLLSAAGLLAVVRLVSGPGSAPGTPGRDAPDVHHDRLQDQLEPDEKG